MFLGPLAQPLDVPADAGLVPFRVPAAEAHTTLEREVFERWLGPADARASRLGQTHTCFVPFWRVDLSIDGRHFGLSSLSVGREGSGFRVPIPIAGNNSRDGVVMVSARRAFPHKPVLPAIFGGDSSAFEVSLHEMVSARTSAESAVRIDADVRESQATDDATRLLMRAAEPQRALVSSYKPTLRSVQFLYYPVHFTTYVYAGESAPEPTESFFVAVSGFDGKVIASHHPSRLRAAAAKFRRLLSFDWGANHDDPSPLSERSLAAREPRDATATPEEPGDSKFRIKID